MNGGSCLASSFPNPTDESKDSDDRPQGYNLPIVDGTDTTIVPSFIGCLGADGGLLTVRSTRQERGQEAPARRPEQGLDTDPLSSPLTRAGKQRPEELLSGSVRETNLPRIEGSDSSPNNNCQRHVYNRTDPSPGSGCIPLPNGATFYPIYSAMR